jgi:hypothetical protein
MVRSAARRGAAAAGVALAVRGAGTDADEGDAAGIDPEAVATLGTAEADTDAVGGGGPDFGNGDSFGAETGGAVTVTVTAGPETRGGGNAATAVDRAVAAGLAGGGACAGDRAGAEARALDRLASCASASASLSKWRSGSLSE